MFSSFREKLKKTKKRLNDSELNAISAKVASDYRITKPFNTDATQRYWVMADKKTVICPMSQDKPEQTIEHHMPFIGDTVSRFLRAAQADKVADDYTLLLPFYLTGREHAVLIEINLKNKSVHVHDAQGSLLVKNSPQELADLFYSVLPEFSYDPEVNYHAYGSQKLNPHLCGYFVAAFIRSYVEMGNTDYIPNITLPRVKSKDSYLANLGITATYFIDHSLDPSNSKHKSTGLSAIIDSQRVKSEKDILHFEVEAGTQAALEKVPSLLNFSVFEPLSGETASLTQNESRSIPGLIS